MDIASKIHDFYSLEQLSELDTAIHRRHPLAKLIVTVCYLVTLMSMSRYDLFYMSPFVFYPVLLCAVGEIPYGMVLSRVAVALPLALMAGLSNLLLDHTVYMTIGSVTVSGGMISLLSLLLRTCLCVWAVLLLIATTPFTDLTRALRSVGLPISVIMLFEMVYRYIGLLADEVSTMVTAYRLRSGQKGIDIRLIGSFCGQLLLRSVSRAERIWQAMVCRGYGGQGYFARMKRFTVMDYSYTAVCIALLILIRFWRI